ncbi:putative death-receptor fusion protein-domain-containing protein [Halteromyces radiatus]|uniref:putative death-receptor fusion protein-domain-containing protein n=1 Tax=Halteromyces radiatus TaxID=101107 RepID=UPI0022204CD9|nr:putative death-receptor fusion protein-domain-containing protein [Halteromyces radiatus]KAI8097284.1 putative death-receptor fusion protein-domain-containing protein [Halteromyces radiatus]
MTAIRKNMKDMSTTDKSTESLDDNMTENSQQLEDENMGTINEEGSDTQDSEHQQQYLDDNTKNGSPTSTIATTTDTSSLDAASSTENKDKNDKEADSSKPTRTYTQFGSKKNGDTDDWSEFAEEEEEEDNQKQKSTTTIPAANAQQDKSKYTFGSTSGFGTKGWATSHQTTTTTQKATSFTSLSGSSFGSFTPSSTSGLGSFSSSTSSPSNKATSAFGAFANAPTSSPFAMAASGGPNALSALPKVISTTSALSPAGSASSVTSSEHPDGQDNNDQQEEDKDQDNNIDNTEREHTFGEGNKIKVPGIKPTEIRTGEEDENTVYQTKAKLLVLDTTSNNWKERGSGTFRINVKDVEISGTTSSQARLVMRADSVYRLILNLLLFAEMKVFIMQDRFVRFAGFESEMKENVSSGKKSGKFPSQLFTKWKTEVIEKQESLLSTHADLPLVVALTSLINGEDQSWVTQSSYLKQIVQILKASGQIKDSDKTKQVIVDLVKSIVNPIAALGYFYASENNTRRLFIPLLEAIQLFVHDTNDSTLIDVYTDYLSQEKSDLTKMDNDISDDNSDNNAFAHKSLTIHMTLDFELGRQLITNTYELTLRYLVRHILSCQQLLEKATTIKDRNMDQIVVNVHYLVKTTMSLLTRSDTTEKILGGLLDAKTTVDDNPYVSLLSQLTNALLKIITQSSFYGKDCCQVAGMAVGAVMNLGKDASFVRDWILGWFFVDTERKSFDAANHMSILFGINSSSRLENTGWEGKDAPMLFIIRGMISTVRKEVLFCPCDPELPIRHLKSYEGVNHLFGLCFVGTKYFCMMDSGDSQGKVVAFEAMSTWLLELKNMMIENKKKDNDVYDASKILSNSNVDILIHFVWNYWDDPIDSLQHRVRMIFELLLAILDIRAAYFHEEEVHQQYLLNLLKNLLMMDWHRKVKYALMTMLVVKLGTAVYFDLEPQLVWKCLRAMDSLSLSSQIAGFVLELLNRYILESVPSCKPSKGQSIKLIGKDEETKILIDRWVILWAIPMLRCLTSSSDILRQNASGFILQPLFKTNTDSFWYLMDILNNTTHEAWTNLDQQYRLHAFISVLKIARSLDIVDGSLYTREDEQTKDSRKVSASTLKLVAYHLDPQIRIDALGLLCESRKGAAVVTDIELEMIKYFLPLNMNCNSPEFRQKLCAHLTKLLTRLRGNIYAQYRIYLSHMTFVEKATNEKRPEEEITDAQLEMEKVGQTIQQGKEFLYWLNNHVANSLYPGASYQRVATALRILNILVKVYGIPESSANDNDMSISDDDDKITATTFSTTSTTIGIHGSTSDFPFTIPLASPRNAKLLIDTLMDSYDFNRNLAFDILCQFPSPLPGVTSKENVQDLLWWGLNNVVSTRAGESDSGAMIFRLIFTKYVTGLEFNLYPQQSSSLTLTKKKKRGGAKKKQHQGSAAVIFTNRLLDMLEDQIEIAKSNLLLAAQHHPMHGTLLALQYVFREVDYQDSRIMADQAKWKDIHARTLALIQSVCDSVMDVLSNPSPEGNVPACFKEMDETITDIVGQDTENLDAEFGPKHQVILSCCWRAVKEASSLLEVIIVKVPLARNRQDRNALLTFVDLEKSGSLLRTLLTSIRHRGAFSAVYPTYVSLCSRLLGSQDSTLNSLPHKWIKENLSSLTSSNISITRRSAGLPLCILAIVSSESVTKKELLGETFQQLLKLAGEEPPMDADQRVDLPQVHAYNIMRTIFMDSKLGTRVLEYASDGFFLAINGFSSSSWAIRNCAVMLFSTLLQRTLGTKKTRDEHSNVNNLTGQEFFTRFPKLHSYLLKELANAVDQLFGKSMADSVHPGLYPMLTLLSRLRPSVMDDATDALSMAPFIPLVLSCAGSSIFKTREMAARALVPLVSSTVSLVVMIADLLEWDEKLTQNEIHGRLIQVQFLLRGHLYQGSTSKDTLLKLIKSLPGVIVSCLSVANQLNEISQALLLDIISEFFLDCKWIFEDRSSVLIDELISVSDESFETLRGFVLSYCNETIQTKSEVGLIGTYLARQSMANVVVLGHLNFGISELPSILYLLDDPDYEVRLLTMTKLMTYFNKVDNSTKISGITTLQHKLIQKTYDGEDNIHCFATAAKFLMNLNKSSPYPKETIQNSNSIHFTLDQYWNKLLDHFTKRQSILVTESVLPLLGALFAQILQSPLNNDFVQSCLKTWSTYVVKYSNKEVALPLREAVVKSIEFTAKHLFMHTIQLGEEADGARTLAELAIIQLLQDDDIDIRQNMATIVSEALQLVAPVHPERAVELIHRHLTIRVVYPARLQTVLTQNLIGVGKLRSVWHDELTSHRALFEKENPNIYKEDMVDIQWAAVDLDQLHYHQSADFSRIMQQQSIFMMDVANQLIDFCRLLEPASGASIMKHGPYGITSRPTLFLVAYRLLLTMTFSYDYLAELPELAPDFVPLTKELKSALHNVTEESVHPLLWQQLHGESGLAGKIHQFLRRFNKPTYNMFLIAPDFRE